MYEIERHNRLSQALVHFVIDRASLFTDHGYRVFQFVSSIIILEQFESILLTILPRILILLLRNDGHQCMESILCRVVESFCLSTRNIVPHISWHVLPCHRTTQRYSDFQSMVIFCCSCGNYGFKHGSIIVNNIFASFTLSLSAPQVHMSVNDVGSPKSTSLFSPFHIGSRFCFFPANLMSSTHTDKNNPFDGVRISIAKLEFSQNRIPRGFSRDSFCV